MARQARGIEVFGRSATVVEPTVRERTPALGAGSLLVSLAAVGALVGAILERTELFTWIALVTSAIAVLGGLVALLSGRGRVLGFAAAIVGALANPWLLTQLLLWAATLPTS
jgi:hypothetical protein